MDSQQRHELKDNDLVTLLDRIRGLWNDKEWWARYGNKILLVLVLLAAALLIKSWADRRAEALHEQLWADLSLASSPESYDAIATSYSDTSIRALALLRAGDLLVHRAVNGDAQQPAVPTADGQAQPTTPASDPQTDARNAVLRYEELLTIQGVDKLVRFNALLGLASAHENLHQWDQARQAYEKLKTEAGQGHPLLTVRADNRLAILPRLDEPVHFAPEPPAVPEPTSDQPAGAPAPLPGLGTVPLPPAPAAAPAPPQPESPPAAEDAPPATNGSAQTPAP